MVFCFQVCKGFLRDSGDYGIALLRRKSESPGALIICLTPDGGPRPLHDPFCIGPGSNHPMPNRCQLDIRDQMTRGAGAAFDFQHPV